jgi:hypothetical protein
MHLKYKPQNNKGISFPAERRTTKNLSTMMTNQITMPNEERAEERAE